MFGHKSRRLIDIAQFGIIHPGVVFLVKTDNCYVVGNLVAEINDCRNSLDCQHIGRENQGFRTAFACVLDDIGQLLSYGLGIDDIVPDIHSQSVILHFIAVARETLKYGRDVRAVSDHLYLLVAVVYQMTGGLPSGRLIVEHNPSHSLRQRKVSVYQYDRNRIFRDFRNLLLRMRARSDNQSVNSGRNEFPDYLAHFLRIVVGTAKE